jgi:hypothetical protein
MALKSKTVTVAFRVSEADYESLHHQAQAYHTSVSSLVRQTVLAGTGQQPRVEFEARMEACLLELVEIARQKLGPAHFLQFMMGLTALRRSLTQYREQQPDAC